LSRHRRELRGGSAWPMRQSVAAHHVELSNYNSTSRISLQGNSCISLSKFLYP